MRKDSFENSFDRLNEYISQFHEGDTFVMESTGFYEPLYDFIESHGFAVKLANPLKICLIAESRMKNDDVDCNRRLIFVHFRRNKTDPHRRFNFDPCPCQDSGLNCTVWRCGE